ncbi:MAG: isoleucyl-tRNA synthetase [Parcubacteria group bacterium Gr01-1014_38]|nr:MAG: isoleucyl-tRNA synthetase [Parcubacteria group bacterium Gr01-1014_38]
MTPERVDVPKARHAGPAAFQPDAIEQEVLRWWKTENTFEESLKRRENVKRYSFYDGPPYATGYPHYGHVLQTTIKDTVTRYWTMRGFLVDRRVGWDCHGLPVENMVEAELGTKTKRGIEEYGIEKFNAKCRSTVLSRVEEFTALLHRLGRWADYSKAYRTMDASFMESAWWVFKTAWDRGLVYRGLRSSPYCPRCETPLSNFEAVQGYQEVTDHSVTVKFPLQDEEHTYLLVWTTTPWTLTANAAIAVHPDLRYVRARVGPEIWIVAKDRLADVIREEYSVEEEFTGSTLVGHAYQPIYRFVEPTTPAFRVVAGPFVSHKEGTGLVHIAPAFGDEDFRLGQDEHLPLIQTVDIRGGHFLPVVGPESWRKGDVWEAVPAIVEDLDAKGVLLRDETIRHDYPHCWRCSKRLLYMAVDSWFIAVTKMKEQLLKNAEQIQWVPAHLKDGRFGQGLRDAPDWAISRTRYWGIPLPVWQCAACEEYAVVGSVQELQKLGGDLSVLTSPHAKQDLHRPYVDRVVLKCPHCGGEARRVPEVLDVWFDSGSMPYGQWHYPFENRELVESTFPADFIGESLEMTRGWFYTLHVLAGILTLKDLGLGTGKPAFKNVVASGLVLAEDGRKLSKRFGNYPEPDGMVSKYGADTLRLYLLSSAKTGEDYRFSDQLVGDLYRRFTLILWNVWQYYRTYAGSRQEAVGNGEQPSLLDRWILARTAQLASEVQSAMDAYHLDDASRALIPFLDDLSSWYVRRSRGRTEALPVLGEVLRTFSLVAAPFIPFLAEVLYRGLAKESPHLGEFPSDVSAVLDTNTQRLLEHMQTLRELASAGQRVRAEAKIKVRQPLAEVVLVGTFPALEATGEEGLALLRDELNVKRILSALSPPDGSYVWVDVVGGKLGLGTELTQELRDEGIVRELIRQVQELRKQAGCRFDEEILLSLDTDDRSVRAAIERFASLLREETKSGTVQFQRGATEVEATVNVGKASVWLGVKRQR